jgi:hypothetical protein
MWLRSVIWEGLMLDVEWEELVGVRAGVEFRDEGVGEFEKGGQRLAEQYQHYLLQFGIHHHHSEFIIIQCDFFR